MTQTAPRTFLAALLLPMLLAGCDALYDDTKGWANRLEASVLGTGNEAGEPAPEAAAAGIDSGPAAMPAPPAVPVEAVAVTPLAAPEAPAKPAETAKAAEPEGVLAEASAALLAPAAAAPAKMPEASAPEIAAKAEVVTATPAAPKAKPAAPSSDEAVVAVVLHLSSLRSEEAAKRQWRDLQKSFPEPLGGLQAEFRRTELGDKGTFYRVLAGPLPTRDRAGEVCAALKAKDARQYCRILPQQPKG